MHFFHPCWLMTCARSCADPRPRDDTCARAVAWSKRMGRTPIVVEKEIDGFIVNRILGAASREASRSSRVASPRLRTSDIAVRQGAQLADGPLQLADFSGLDTVLTIAEIGWNATMRLVTSRPLPFSSAWSEPAGSARKSAGFYDYAVDPPGALPPPD